MPVAVPAAGHARLPLGSLDDCLALGVEDREEDLVDRLDQVLGASGSARSVLLEAAEQHRLGDLRHVWVHRARRVGGDGALIFLAHFLDRLAEEGVPPP